MIKLFDYWDRFVDRWYNGTMKANMLMQHCEWSDPDSIPLYNDNIGLPYSYDFLPEPWWGWNPARKEFLHSVVINFNPGSGDIAQHRNCIAYSGSYSDIVNGGILPATEKWHYSKRAIPVLRALESLNYISGPYSIWNHLSIEVLPWHTKTANANYRKYITHGSNAIQIFETVFRFAALASSHIVNTKLKDKVIVKMNESNIAFVLKALANVGYTSKITVPVTSCPIEDGKFLEFMIDNLPHTKFICIWGSKSRNNFPGKRAMEWILSNIS
jgi:hypothetical protein